MSRLFDAEVLDEDLATVAVLAIIVAYRQHEKRRTDGVSG